jgi:dipeptidyl aminopeptidase/acylaminoacyl peptidase
VSAPVLIPREVLFGNPEKVSPQISPDGKRLAYIAPVDNVLNVWVGTIGGEFTPVTDDRERGIRAYTWAHDNKHLLYIQDKGGDENWHIYRVDPDTRTTVDVTPIDGVTAQFVSLSKRFPNDVLVGLNNRVPQLHDVYHLALDSGELTLVEENPGFASLFADAQQKVRGAVRPRPDGGLDVLVRDNAEESDWRVLAEFPLEDNSGGPAGFNLAGDRLMLRSSVGANTVRLVDVDLASGAETVIAEDPTFDVGGFTRHPDTLEVQLVTFVTDKIERRVLDPSIQPDLDALQALHPGEEVTIVDRDHADRTWIVGFWGDRGPNRYYAWDRDAKDATFLFVSRSDLEQFELAAMEPFSFTSRDGLTIHGYATFPPGVDRTNLPTVLNVHGGPWARDMWGFDPYAQWFANRGYLCVQVNYRGSTGYGKAFLNAGDREWGGKMHDDLIDAVDYIVAQGWADRERVAIHGGSYGGYAALAGLTFTPDTFCCAVDIVGPSNLKTLIESVPEYWKPMIANLHARVGNPAVDEEFMWSRSPLSRVDQIKKPLLIGQGANDPRVKQAESEQIVGAMTERGIDHEYMLFEDEGHGFAKPENRMTFAAATERFLARHLGGRCEEESAQALS